MEIDFDRFRTYKPKGYPVQRRPLIPFQPAVKISQDFKERSMAIREMDARLDCYILTADDYFEIVTEAYATNIHLSTSLEGNPLTKEEVLAITRKSMHNPEDEVMDADYAPMREVLNHLVNWIFPEFFTLPWTDETVLGIFGGLFFLGNRKILDGDFAYRSDHSCVWDSEGNIIFKPASGNTVQTEMDELLRWVNDYSSGFDPIVASSIIFHEFESIHPFHDGNGRVGRTLFHLYLQNNGLPNSNLCLIEQEMLRDREVYFQMLAYTDEQKSYTNWIDFVTQVIQKSYENTIRRFEQKNTLENELDEESILILRSAKQRREWFDIGVANGWVKGIKYESVRTRLKNLEKMGYLESRGKTRGRMYRFNDPLRTFRELSKKAIEAMSLLGIEG